MPTSVKVIRDKYLMVSSWMLLMPSRITSSLKAYASEEKWMLHRSCQ